jgi:hypothetical protein
MTKVETELTALLLKKVGNYLYALMLIPSRDFRSFDCVTLSLHSATTCDCYAGGQDDMEWCYCAWCGGRVGGSGAVRAHKVGVVWNGAATGSLACLFRHGTLDLSTRAKALAQDDRGSANARTR